MRFLLDNPEFMRHFRKSTRKGKAKTTYTIFLAACGLCVAVNLFFFYESPAYRSVQSCFRSIFFQIIGANFLLLLGFGAHGCGDSVSSERHSNTLDFQRITGANPYALAFGKIFGVPFVHYLLAAASMPVTMACVVYGGVSPAGYALAYLLLLVFGLSYCSITTVASAFRKEKGRSRTSPVVLFLFLLWLGPTLGLAIFRGAGAMPGLAPGLWTCLLPFHSLSALGRTSTGGYALPFYGITVSGIAMTICLNAFLFLACWAGTARRIENDSQSLWSRTQLFGGSIGVFVLLGSYLWNELARPDFWTPIAISTIGVHGLLMIVAAVAAPGHYAYRLGLRQAREGGLRGTALLSDRRMAVSFVLTLILVYAGLVVGILVSQGSGNRLLIDPFPIALIFPSVLICGMTFAAMAQWFKLAAPHHGMKLYGGILIAWTVVPVVAGLILTRLESLPRASDIGTFFLFLSPIGTCVHYLRDGGTGTFTFTAVLSAFAVLTAAAGWMGFLMNRFRRAFDQRCAARLEPPPIRIQ